MKSEAFWQWFDEFAAPKLSESKVFPRERTFRKMFEHLDTFERPVHIVETGCIEEPDNWVGNGCSTILFDKYVETHPGATAVSIEIIKEKVKAAKALCHNVVFNCGDSVKLLADQAIWNRPVDLLYLDASHHSWINEAPSQVHHFNELMAIMPKLHAQSLVVVDDSVVALDDYPQQKIVGKGGIVSQYALEVGADLEFCDYQVGFTNITGKAPVELTDIEELVERARAHAEAGRGLAADRLYRLIMIATPPPWSGRARIARGEACANFARNAGKLKKYGVAIDWYRDALAVDPRATDYRIEMVRNLVSLGALNVAQREAAIAAAIEPAYAPVWATVGGVEADLLNAKGCAEAYDKQIETIIEDDVALSDAYLNRATIALDTKDYESVRYLCRRIINLKVREGDGWHVLAMLAYRESDHEMAIALFETALERGCRNQPLTHWNKSLPLHAIGRYREGWEEHNWGKQEITVQAIYIPHHRFTLPEWEGQPAPATIHVHTEAGHGDNIAMLRYLPLLLERGYTVRYECDPLLLDLAKVSLPGVEVIPRAVDYPGALGLKAFDYHIPIGDLPHVFGTDIDTVPWSGPYLKATAMRTARYAEKLAQAKGRKIGLCWSSGIRRNMNIWMEQYGQMKSMHFDDLTPLLRLLDQGDALISLQIGDGRDEHHGALVDLLPEKPDWAETAALIANLDLVITVDTGVAHLAGAMGKPVWVMTQRDGTSWHFMCYREGASWNTASPWYPSARIFRQHEGPGNWADVVADIAEALNEEAKCGMLVR